MSANILGFFLQTEVCLVIVCVSTDMFTEHTVEGLSADTKPNEMRISQKFNDNEDSLLSSSLRDLQTYVESKSFMCCTIFVVAVGIRKKASGTSSVMPAQEPFETVGPTPTGRVAFLTRKDLTRLHFPKQQHKWEG